MATNSDGSIILTVKVDSNSLGKELESLKKKLSNGENGVKSFGNATNSLSTSLTRFAKSIGIAFSVAQLVKFSNQASKLAAETESYIMRIGQIYGEASKTVTDFVNANSQALGMSKTVAYEAATSYGNLFSSFADGAQNAQLTNQMLNTTAVIASKTGRTFDEVFTKIQSGIFGNTRAIDDLGVYVNQATLQYTQAFQTISDGRPWAQLTGNEQKQVLTLAILEQAQAKYGNTVLQSTALTRSQFSAAFQDFKSTWGRVVNVVLMPVLQVLTTIFNYATMALNAVLGLFGKEIKSTSAEVQQTTQGISDISDGIGGAAGKQKGLTDAVKGTNKELKKTLAGFDEIQMLQSDNTSSGGGGGSGGGGSGGGGSGGGGSGGGGSIISTPQTTIGDIEIVNTEAYEKFQGILTAIAILVTTIGGSLLAWKIADSLATDSTAFLGKLQMISGILLIIAGAILSVKGYSDAWVNGIGWDNLSEVLGGMALLITGIALALSPVAAGFAAVGAGIALVILGIKDIIENGPNLQNILTVISGSLLIVLGVLTSMGKISAFKTLIPALFALAGVITTIRGVSDALINGLDWNNFSMILLGLATTVTAITVGFGSFGGAISLVVGSIVALVTGITSLVNDGYSMQAVILVVVGAIGLLIGVILLFNASLLASPITWIVIGLVALAGAFTILWNECEGFRNFFLGMWEGIKTAFQTFVDWISPAIETIKGYFEGLWTKLQEIWAYIIQSVTPIAESIGNAFTQAWELIKVVWDLVKPYFSAIWNAIKAIFSVVGKVLSGFFSAAWTIIKAVWDAVSPYFSAVWESIKAVFSVVSTFLGGAFSAAWAAIKLVWDTVTGYFKVIWDTIATVFSVVKDVLLGDFSAAWDAIKELLNTWAEFFGKIWDDIKLVFSTVKDWFKDTFSAAWDAIKDVFSGWGEFFSGLWDKIKETFSSLGTSIANAIGGAVKSGINTVITLIENTINRAISLINGAIGLINKIPGVNVGRIGSINLPRLAKGAVLPANKPFLAVVGDQKSGTNIEAPAKLIKQMAMEAIVEAQANLQGTQQTVKEEHYYLDQTELMSVLYRLVRGGERIQGNSLINQGGSLI